MLRVRGRARQLPTVLAVHQEAAALGLQDDVMLWWEPGQGDAQQQVRREGLCVELVARGQTDWRRSASPLPLLQALDGARRAGARLRLVAQDASEKGGGGAACGLPGQPCAHWQVRREEGVLGCCCGAGREAGKRKNGANANDASSQAVRVPDLRAAVQAGAPTLAHVVDDADALARAVKVRWWWWQGGEEGAVCGRRT